MSKKRTHVEYVNELLIKNPNVKVIGQYTNSKASIMHYCLIHNVSWKTAPARVLQGCGCPECKKEKFRQVRCKTHQQYIQEVKNVNTNIEVIEQYIDARTPIKHYCKKHNIFWDAAPSNILQGYGCPECGKDKIGEKNRKTHTEYVKELEIINSGIEIIGEYQGAHIPTLHKCKIDGHVWHATPANVLFGKGCPVCNESKGERQIRQWLQKYNIEYVYQKTFIDCKDINALPFDFYIPKYNICIEYDGEQHFRPVNFDGRETELVIQQFKKLQQHDKIKNQYCKNNNINLLRIPYYKDTKEELEHFFIHLI